MESLFKLMQGFFLDPVYPITSPRTGQSHVELAELFILAGVRFFQVREKNMTDFQLFDQLRQIRNLCSASAARFVVNDRVDLALACGADGVHLGQEDLPVKVARRLLGPDAVVGLSTHDRRQFLEAQQQEIDYVAAGPIFETSTKHDPRPVLGVRFLEELCDRSRVPVVAIGGITIERAWRVWKAGATSVAVISDILDSADPAARIRSYLEQGKNVH